MKRNGTARALLDLPPDSAGAAAIYSRVFELLEAGLVEIVLRPTTPARRSSIAAARHEDHVQRFLRERVAPAAKMTVTSRELLFAYQGWLGERGLPLPNDMTALKALEPAMKEVFGICQRRDVKRNGKRVRGYWGVGVFMAPGNGEEEE